MAFDEALEVFFQPDMPGIFAAYMNGGTTPIYGAFQVSFFDPLGNLSEDRQFSFQCAAYSLPTVAVGDTLAIDGKSYRVFQVLNDGDIATITLQQQ